MFGFSQMRHLTINVTKSIVLKMNDSRFIFNDSNKHKITDFIALSKNEDILIKFHKSLDSENIVVSKSTPNQLENTLNFTSFVEKRTPLQSMW